ncbi:MAG: hypothetical protein ACJAVK_003196 [Akkermansiaceae bacterium]|jgi:hypothetical protein
MADEDLGIDLNRHALGVVGEPNGGVFEFRVVLQRYLTFDFFKADIEFDGLSAHIHFPTQNLDFGELGRGDGMKGHDDEISVFERHATDLEQSAKESEPVRIGEALGFRPWDALFGVFLGPGHAFRGEAEARDIVVVTLPFGSCEHDGAQRF